MEKAKPRFSKYGRRVSKESVRLRNSGLIQRMLVNLPLGVASPEAIQRAARRFCSDEKEAADLARHVPDAMQRLTANHCIPRGRPRCLQCPVRMLCNNWRTNRAKAEAASGQPTIAEFFAGAGGMSLGFEQAGFHTDLAVDIELDATHTYLVNRPEMRENDVVCGDVKEFLTAANLQRLRHVDGIIGGPPCQTFSLVGYRTKGYQNTNEKILDDSRTWLPTAFARIIAEAKPRFAIMENVAAFRSALNGNVREEVLRTLKEAKFAVAEAKVWAHKNGAPQKRCRYILIAIRGYGAGGISEAQAKADRIRASLEAGTVHGRTVREALSVLEPFGKVGPGEGYEYSRSGDHETWNHYARFHNERDLEIYAKLRPGQTARELEKEAPGSIPYQTDSFGDKYRKIHPDGYSPTIPAHLKKDANSFILHDVNRGVTPREAALLQGFPLDYVFLGPQSHQFMQIGNAVPPPVGKAVASLMKAELFAN